ncbi:MAG: hypothetical protein AABN33_16975 [Acidobacteriota bacterium]
MLRLPYQPEQFGRHLGPALTLGSEIRFSWSAVCRAALTVGRRNWPDVLAFGTYSVLECLWRLAMVRANLVEEASGRLRKSTAFVALDRSEKSAVSYFLGLVFTKLIAERLFGVSWLLHLDVYRQYLDPTLAFNERPDFVGTDTSGYWIVIESKGRSGGAPNDLLTKAKRQTRSLRRVAGELPILRVAVATYFSRNDLCARIRDPEDFDEGAPDVDIGPETFGRAYYRPLVELLGNLQHERKKDPRNGRSYIHAQLPGLDAAVALDEEVLKWYRSPEATWQQLLNELPASPSVLAELEHRLALNDEERQRPGMFLDDFRHRSLGTERLWEDLTIGHDGVFIELGTSWTTEYMRREPSERLH